jgi:hypothetical protein
VVADTDIRSILVVLGFGFMDETLKIQQAFKFCKSSSLIVHPSEYSVIVLMEFNDNKPRY